VNQFITARFSAAPIYLSILVLIVPRGYQRINCLSNAFGKSTFDITSPVNTQNILDALQIRQK